MSSIDHRRNASRRPIRPPRYIDVDFACNADNGCLAGHASQAEFLGFTVENWDDDSCNLDGPAFHVEKDLGCVRLHGRRFYFVWSQDYVGNLCWTRFRFERRVARSLLLCMKRNGWAPDSGPRRMWNWWGSL